MGIFAYLFYYYYYFSWAFIKLKLLLSSYDVRVINGLTSTFALCIAKRLVHHNGGHLYCIDILKT